MKLFVLPEPPDANDRVTLAHEAYHYLVRVRRLGVGQVFEAVDPAGRRGRVLIQRVEPDRLWGLWEGASDTEASEPLVHVYPALLKGRKLDDVLRASTECGLTRWQPWIAHFSQNRDPSPSHRERWRKIAHQAMMQSGRGRFPDIAAPVPFPALVESLRECPTLIVFHHLPHRSEPLHRILEAGPQPIGLVFGPEGGLESSELDVLQNLGARFTWLGHGILRSETAILYGLASVHTLIRERDSWKTP